MDLQEWNVYRQDEEGNNIIGTVKTSKDANVKTATAKACFKFNGNRNYTIGWKMIVKKAPIKCNPITSSDIARYDRIHNDIWENKTTII